MRRLHIRFHAALFLVILALMALPAMAENGAFYIAGNLCFCATTTHLNEWNAFPVHYIPDSNGDCAGPLQAAFRIVGVPDDPALQRFFDTGGHGMIGDIFAEGARLTGLEPDPGELILGTIFLYLTQPLASQVWSIEAHQGIAGVSTPVMEFDSSPGTWTPQPAYALTVGGPSTACDTCNHPYAGCPFAVEPATWTLIKLLYD